MVLQYFFGNGVTLHEEGREEQELSKIFETLFSENSYRLRPEQLFNLQKSQLSRDGSRVGTAPNPIEVVGATTTANKPVLKK